MTLILGCVGIHSTPNARHNESGHVRVLIRNTNAEEARCGAEAVQCEAESIALQGFVSRHTSSREHRGRGGSFNPFKSIQRKSNTPISTPTNNLCVFGVEGILGWNSFVSSKEVVPYQGGSLKERFRSRDHSHLDVLRNKGAE